MNLRRTGRRTGCMPMRSQALATMQTGGPRRAARLAALRPRPADARNGTHARSGFCAAISELQISVAERSMLDRLFDALAQRALEQPATFVHRDYHSRNLLLTADNNPGILDFQDAVRGPVTYDVVSLLKDCYIAWPASRVRAWALQHRELLLAKGFPVGLTEEQFIRWFDLIGLQRHIKVLGIFARLYYRDGKVQYLKDLPRVLRYARETAALYPETAEFAEFITQRIEPEFAAAQERALE